MTNIIIILIIVVCAIISSIFQILALVAAVRTTNDESQKYTDKAVNKLNERDDLTMQALERINNRLCKIEDRTEWIDNCSNYGK